jgi:GTPase SAR1 family protein
MTILILLYPRHVGLILFSQGEDAARSIGAVDYFECSAKTGDGVKNVFDTVIRHATSKLDEDELKRASRLRRQKIKRGVEDTRRKFSNMFCSSPRKLSHRLA